MNNQEFEQKMNFIVEQHARFPARLEERDVREVEFDRKHQIWKIEIEDILTRLARVTNVGFKELDVKINALIDAQIRTEDEQRKTDEQLRKTEELFRRYFLKRNGENKN